MADFAGLALTALVEANHIAQAIYKTWQSARHFGDDAASLHTRFSASQINLKAYERVLFTTDRFPSAGGRLVDLLPGDVCQNLVEMLFELHAVLNRYTMATKSYSVAAESGDDAPFNLGEEMSDDERTRTVLALGLSRAEQQARSGGWVRKTWWAVWDKKNVERLVQEFERWIDRVRLLIETAWWPLPYFASTTNLDHLRRDEDTIQAGMTGDIGLRKLIVAHPDTLGYVRNLESKAKFERMIGDSQNTNYGWLDGETVLVEYHDYETDSRTGSMDDKISARIMRLVALMHESNDARFKVMKCTNYIDDKLSKKFGFVFTLPQPMSACPNTLLKYLSCRPSLRPNLTARVKLAHTLAETVQLLHSVGWVHKSLRSEKILFLRAAEPESGNPANSKPKTESLDLHHPRIFGFEFSRLESDYTSLSADLEIRRNIYRHPDRWGYPKQAFSKVHDIYGSSIVPFLSFRSYELTIRQPSGSFYSRLVYGRA